MSRGLLSPRGAPPAPGDAGARPRVLARQRVRRRRGAASDPARRRRRLATALALLVAGAGAAAGVHWLLTSPRFAVRAVEVRGLSRVPAERVLAAAAIPPGANLWRIDPTAVVARVQALPEIRRAELVRELPNRVTLRVEERRPFTLVGGPRLHWLDEEGRLLGEAADATAPPVPVITGLSEQELVALATAPSPRVQTALALIRTLLRHGSPLTAAISEIDVSRREGPVLYTVDGVEVRLGAEEWEERLGRLEGVLARLAAEGTEVRAIDLRFRDQVVLRHGG